jgi:hypothetical protein
MENKYVDGVKAHELVKLLLKRYNSGLCFRVCDLQKRLEKAKEVINTINDTELIYSINTNIERLQTIITRLKKHEDEITESDIGKLGYQYSLCITYWVIYNLKYFHGLAPLIDLNTGNKIYNPFYN